MQETATTCTNWDKPGKDEKVVYFEPTRICFKGCAGCDTKRSEPCKDCTQKVLH